MVSSNLPTILCLHGMGTSASIFEAQTRNLRWSLRSHFRFVFIDAPHESMPGPGVEPTYVDSGPFYSWFPKSLDYCNTTVMANEFHSLNEHIAKSLSDQDVQRSDIVSVLGFSQGTIVASMLLYQAQYQNIIAGVRRASMPDCNLGGALWAGLRFGILLSGSCNDGVVTAFMGKKLQLPSVHVHGLQDAFLDYARMLRTKIYHATSSDVYEFDGGHNIPGSKADVDKLTALILRLNRKTKTKKINC